MKHFTNEDTNVMSDYEFSIMSHLKDDDEDEDDNDVMSDYEFSIMSHLKNDY